MNAEIFSEAMSELDNKYINEAVQYQKKKLNKPACIKWGSLAACLCLMLVSVFSAAHYMRLSNISNSLPLSDNTIHADIPSQPDKNNDTSVQDEAGKHELQNTVIDETMTLEEAQSSKPFGSYMLTAVPAGFHAETIQRYQDENADYLFGLWTKVEGSFDEISWRVLFYDETMENRVTSIEDTRNYDLSLYPLPLADSVPDELFEIVDHPIFDIDELTLAAVNRRAYSINESGDTDGIRMSFSVRYGEVVVEVATKGASPEWVYEQIRNCMQR